MCSEINKERQLLLNHGHIYQSYSAFVSHKPRYNFRELESEHENGTENLKNILLNTCVLS